jgi:hypothetical protein
MCAVEVASLRGAEWVRTWDVAIEDHASAVDSENHFDALMTAAAALRLTLDSLPPSTFASDPVAEGAIQQGRSRAVPGASPPPERGHLSFVEQTDHYRDAARWFLNDAAQRGLEP